MREKYRVSNRTASVILSLFMLGGTFLHCSAAQAAPQQYQYSNACYDCHGTATTDPANPPDDFRPIDAPFRNITTGGFQGSHRTHMAQTIAMNVCEKCHTGSGSYTTGHMNDRIDMTANLNSSPVASKYSKAVSPLFFNWTSDQSNMGTCSNNNCHFEKITPTWAGTPFSYTNNTTNDCDQCHGAPPTGGGTGTEGSHTQHNAYYSGAVQCKKCHVDHLGGAGNKFSHATSATRRGIIVAILDPTDVPAGSYSGTGANFLPSQSGSQSFGNCTNLYCHSQGLSASTFNGGNAPKTVATWGGSMPPNCEGCHGGNVTAAGNAINTNMHAKHINNAGAVGRNINCKECHTATVASDTTIASTANHPDKNINIKFDNSGVNKDAYGPVYSGSATTVATGATKAPGSALGAGCANIYCHSDGHPAGGSRTYLPIAWNGPAIGCNGCHGTGNGTGYPEHGNAGSGLAGSNSHTAHSANPGYSIGCVRCHSGTTSDNTSVINGSAHLNGTSSIAGTDVKFDTFDPSGSYAGGQTCNATYCHSSGNGNPPKKVPVWGDTMPADCTGCHGGNAAVAAYNIISSGRHTAHMNNPAYLGSANNLKCVECHALTVNATDRTIIDKPRHVNKLNDYSGAKAGGTDNYATATGVCSNVYCHSSGQATPVFRNMTGSKAWRASSPLSCKGCHGYETVAQGASFTSVAGEPSHVSGAVGSATANTHQQHVAGRNTTDSRGCADCHRLTVDQGMANKLKDYSSLHLNTTRDVNFGVYGGYTGSYTASSKTCYNTYCHSTGTPRWGGAPLLCNACHNAKADDANWGSAGAHKIHWEGTNLPTSGLAAGNGTGDGTTYRFSCNSCHSTPAVHANAPVSTIQAAEVYFGYTAAGRTGSYTPAGTSAGSDGSMSFTAGGNCTSSYCHSDGNGVAGPTDVNWATTTSTADPAVRCISCHGYTTASGSPIGTGSHSTHVSNYGISCSKCHFTTTSNGVNITDKRKHINKAKDVLWDATNSDATPYSNPNCANIYCHSKGTTFSAPYTGIGKSPNSAAVWSGSIDGCNGCHDYNDGSNDTGPSYANGSPKANSHSKHVKTWGYNCGVCHNDTWNGDWNANHANKSYNVETDGSVTFTPTIGNPTIPSSCASISCHGGNNATWGATLNCQNCHGGVADSDNFTPPFTSASAISIIKMAGEWDTTGHGKAGGSYSSGNPAAAFTAANACLYCHDNTINHDDSTNIFRLRNYSTIAWGRNAPCQVCHGIGSTGVTVPAVKTATKKVSAFHYGPRHASSNNGGQFCWDCHDAHGDGNAYMIHDNVAQLSDPVTGNLTTTVATTFTLSSAPNAAWGDYVKADFSGLCQVCHAPDPSTLAHFRNDLYDANHNPGTRCTVCHGHSDSDRTAAFKPSRTCDLCHGYPPVRRGLTGGTVFRQSNYSSARFEDYSGGGGAHSIEKHIPATAKASEGWANCAVCHSNGNMNPSMSAHTMQTPVVPSRVTIDVKERRKFDYQRSLGAERYSGKMTDTSAGQNTNNTGSCSNTNCHYKPSKKWSIER